uniref:Formimidoyltransferase-cyclodeaminase n=1 Tax=Strigamia maritima TaxID=126957 RepID=T1JH96_STRMM
MPKIVECVPNFSEGQSKEVIDSIASAISSEENVSLLDVDPGSSTNRTVYTFVGSPDAVVEAALKAARIAWKLIDMSKHKGEHPRMGALDVCPFIPVQGVEIEECIYCAKKFGEKLAAELNVPVYLYGLASTQDYRKTMPQIRAGEYEGLIEKLKHPQWKPDFGPSEFVSNWGATVTGVRKFLIAYNVNLLSTKEQAHRIALNVREQGRGKDKPGRLQHCQAIGWWLEEHNLAQVSINLTDHDETPIHTAYEEVRKDAMELNLAVTGSQIVGMVPLKAMLQIANYYIQNENLFVLEEDQKIHLAVNRLGLNSLGPFNPKERIIEYILPSEKKDSLIHQNLDHFIHGVAARTPAPGGGSVAATTAALGSALGTMVGLMTYGKKQWEHLDGQMRKLIPVIHKTMKDIIPIIDADTHAFAEYMEACKLPSNTPEETTTRDSATQSGLMRAIDVPMNLARTINTVWDSVLELANICNLNTKSDLQVAVRCLETGVWGAFYNVMINVDGIVDEGYRNKVSMEIQMEVDRAQAFCKMVLDTLSERSTKNLNLKPEL